MDLSVVIPAYNEEARLGTTFKEIERFIDSHPEISTEVVVIDDGSKDKTFALSKSFSANLKNIRVFKNKRNLGKGRSVRRGVAVSKGKIILFSDADISTPIEEILKLQVAIETGADVAIGSRDIQGAKIDIHQPFYREIMGKIFNIFVRCLLLKGIHDTQCGFKAFRRKVGRKIFARATIEGFGFDVEVLFLAQNMGYKIKEVPVIWKNISGSKVSLIRDSAIMFLDLFRIPFRHYNVLRKNAELK